jgi:hypothetical protein
MRIFELISFQFVVILGNSAKTRQVLRKRRHLAGCMYNLALGCGADNKWQGNRFTNYNVINFGRIEIAMEFNLMTT